MLSSFSGVTFVLFRFRLYTYVEAATLRSIALRYSGAPTATRVSFFFPFFLFSFFPFVSLEMSLFPSTFVPLLFYFCTESTSHVFSFFLPDGDGAFLYIVTAGWIFLHEPCEKDTIQASPEHLFVFVRVVTVCMYVSASHTERVWTNRVRLPILLVVS